MQKSIIVSTQNRLKLEDHLSLGWKVIQMCPMPSSCTSGGNSMACQVNPPTCLVILEKLD